MEDYLKQRAAELPEAIGLYRFLNGQGTVIYVGKSVNIHRRVMSYFSRSYSKNGYLARMIPEIKDIQWRECPHELIALFEEENEVKSLNPRYNSELRDFGKYYFIAVTNEQYPRFFLTQNTDVNIFFGPFFRRFLAEKVFEFVTDIAGLRTCQRMKGGCVRGELGHCMKPCVSDVSEVYGGNCNTVLQFLKGNDKGFIRMVEGFMGELAESGEFEKAAFIRDNRKYLKFYFRRASFVRNFSESPILFTASDGYAILLDRGRIIMTAENGITRSSALARLSENNVSLQDIELETIRLFDRGNILFSWMRTKGGRAVLL